MEKKALAIIIAVIISHFYSLANEITADSTSTELNEVVVHAPRGVRKMAGPFNGEIITASELKRAACCNLGESFTTNPSVDVNYTDAATGARQIRLLGLSGNYVQMLTENVPNFRGAAAPYGLGYIAGPWMQSIQVSKGASSVKNGYESITGQINVEMKKPQLDPSVSVNGYYDRMNKLELNADGNMHFSDKWSGGLLTHFENQFTAHDDNSDSFTDMPRVRQWALMPRVAYLGRSYVFQAAAKYLNELRRSGQDTHHAHPASSSETPLYLINIKTQRWEAMTKNAYMYDRENDGNVALILSGSLHRQDANYGLKLCNANQRELYSQLMYERKFTNLHAISTGATLTYDHYEFGTRLVASPTAPTSTTLEQETTLGAYAQYTLNIDSRLVAMAGVRYDHSNRFGSMFTPRMHLRYTPIELLSIHASAGRGFKTPHPMAEYSYMLASSRSMEIAPELKQEDAWNLGTGATVEFKPFGKKVSISAEYYYTTFKNQLMLNLDADPHKALIYSSDALSRSHALQIEATFEILSDLNFTAAWRLTDVKADYSTGIYNLGVLSKPLQSRNKGLFTIGWSPKMGLWQIDASLAVNGAGRMPTPYTTASGASSWEANYKAFVQLNAQITRNFRHWAVYIGGENLTNFRQPNPIVDAANPWGPNFDATMIYGPLHGANVYVGFRYNFTKFI